MRNNLPGLNFRPLTPDINLSGFTCEDDDLDDFLKSDALFYHEVNIVQTVLLSKNDEIIGYFSLTSTYREKEYPSMRLDVYRK